MERKIFTQLRGEKAAELNEALGRIGFRRSQGVAYRPSCEQCQACVSVRIIAHQFKTNATQRRLLKRNQDLDISVCKPWSTQEQYDLLHSYLEQRHPDGGMVGMSSYDYTEMVEQTPVTSWILEYREPSTNGRPGALIGACLTDQQSDGLSMVYSFYDTSATARKGLGTFMILDHIRRTTEIGLPYVYLGYWIEGCEQMHYKARFQPLEHFTANGWQLMPDAGNVQYPLHDKA